jgi:CheY-like chemotaxis protein
LNLNDLIKNLTKMLGRIIGEDVRLQCMYGGAPPFVHADAGKIEQVLMNLAINARDAMPRGGQLLITMEKIRLDEAYSHTHPEARAGEFVCLSVSDSGSGIAPEHLPRIFEPFFTTKELGKGTGLGLATVYGIVKQHQGWVTVSSRVGVGTTFEIFLPAIQQMPMPAASPRAEATVLGGSENILLVEDDATVRLLTRRMLEAHGYRVWEAASGREALGVWRGLTGRIDLLLTDIVMPDGVSGRELADQLRAQTPELKVIFTSGYSRDVAGHDATAVQESGAHFLQKPCPSHVLLNSVRRCLDGKT